jgi:putative heme-binding domain-containing protein
MVRRLSVWFVIALSAAAQPANVDEQTAIQIEALNRLKGVDLEGHAALKSAVLKVLEKTRGTPQFVELVREFKLSGQGKALLDYSLRYPAESSGVEAFRLALGELGKQALNPLLEGEQGSAVVQLIGNSNEKDLQPILRALVEDGSKPQAVRKDAVRALAQSEAGARFLLDLAREGKLAPDLTPTASSELNRAPWPAIKKETVDLLPLLQSASAEALPPVSELLKRKGDAARGREVFESPAAACSSCHQVNGKGTDVGPALSEIGTKLGKEALYQSILDPSGGISFGYEAWSIELQNGDEVYGRITSETPEEITVKNQTGVLTKYKKADVARRQKSVSSMMPAGLQLTMSTQDLVDLVEYLAALKKQ